MLITLLTAGSRGDTQPFVTLGVALRKAGYSVRVAASKTFEAFVNRQVDQFAWGQRAFELGVGPKPIPKKKLSAEKLAAAISEALTEKVIGAARALG